MTVTKGTPLSLSELRYESPRERVHAWLDRWLDEIGDHGELTVRIEKRHGHETYVVKVNSEERHKVD